MFLDRLFKFRMIAPQLWTEFATLPDEALLELAAATNEDRFYTKNTFSQTIPGFRRPKWRIVNNMLK